MDEHLSTIYQDLFPTTIPASNTKAKPTKSVKSGGGIQNSNSTATKGNGGHFVKKVSGGNTDA